VFGPVALSVVRYLYRRERLPYHLRWVDDTNHAILAMLALCAVEPHRSGSILNGECVGHVGDGCGGLGGNKARPEALVHRIAGLCEGALSNGVVLGPELEHDGVALGSLNAVRHEDQRTCLVADGNGVHFRNSDAGKGGGGEDSREVHDDGCDW
jgi:hypothetical protein